MGPRDVGLFLRKPNDLSRLTGAYYMLCVANVILLLRRDVKSEDIFCSVNFG